MQDKAPRTRFHLNPTLIGLPAVLVWSMSMPLSRYATTQIGVLAVIGVIFMGTGLLGLLTQLSGRQPFPDKAVFRNPFFYARWFFFVAQLVCIWTAMLIVQTAHVPFVILINYLWPTNIIIFSILFAGVTVSRRVVFTAGTILVLIALSVEILGSHTLDLQLFKSGRDCLAYLLALCASLGWGAYSALSRRWGAETGGPTVIPLFQLTLGMALFLSFIPGFSHWDHLTPRLGCVLFGWCLLQFGAFQSWDIGMRRGNIVVLSLCADFIPWLALALSHVMLGVEIGDKTVLSALLLVAGAIIARYGTLPLKIREEIPPGD